jgi:O-acetyl-ADP-ribose deacetylase
MRLPRAVVATRERAMIKVLQGDITGYDGDAVVNAANNHLQLGAGVAGAIRRAAGPAVQAECDRYVAAHGAIRVGEAVATGAGEMAAKWVIHAAAMGDEPATARSIREATAAALARARDLGARRVAFPVLGSGVAGFPFARAARLVLGELLREEGAFDELVLYGYGAADAATLRELIQPD